MMRLEDIIDSRILMMPNGEGGGGNGSPSSPSAPSGDGGNGPGASTHGGDSQGGPGGPGGQNTAPGYGSPTGPSGPAFGPPAGTSQSTSPSQPQQPSAPVPSDSEPVTTNPDGTHTYGFTKKGVAGLANQMQQQGQDLVEKGQGYIDPAQAYLQKIYGEDPTQILSGYNSAAKGQASDIAGMDASNAASAAVRGARSAGLNAGQAGLAGGQTVSDSYTKAFEDSLAKQLDLLSGFRNQNIGAAQASGMEGLQELGQGIQSQSSGLGGLEAAAGLNQQQKNQENQGTSNLLNGAISVLPYILGLF